MARVESPNQYKYTGKGPLDQKSLVNTYAALLSWDTWEAKSGSKIAYNGMITAVWLNKEDPSKNGIYYLFDPNCTSTIKNPDVTNEANWHKIAELSELSTLAERVKVLEDAGIITQEQLNTAIDALKIEIAALGYLTKDDLGEYALKSELPSIEGLASEEFVISAIEAIEPVDITGKLDTSVYEAEKVNFATNDALGVVRATAEAAQTSDQVAAAIAAAFDTANLGQYAKSNDVNAFLATKVDITTYNSDIVSIINSINTLTGKDEEILATLNTKANAGDVYTKPEADALFMTEEEVAAKIAEIPEVDLTQYAKLTDVNAALATKVGAEYVAEQLASIVTPKASEEISVEEDGTLGIKEVSTDKLVQGKLVIVLDGGDAIDEDEEQ